MSVPATSVSFSFRTPNVRRSWLPYFLAAIGAGAAVADEEIMRYYWVMPDAVSQKSPRVIRVMGEKGERYEEVYADETIAALKLHPAIQEARLARQAALRKEAQRLAKQLRESGKEPLVAYEEAWTEVYRKNWLHAGGLNESCRLDDMLARLASENEELNLTEDEQQWLLEALLEDDDRLESEAGLELLRRLAAQLRRMGYGNLDKTLGVNDELMKRFAEAMRHMPDSMNAFRDALFKTKRGSVGNHTLVGFRAPWGIKVGGGWHYHQAPLPVETTEGSGNTQLPAEIPLTVGSGQSLTGSANVEIPGAADDFLATSPEQSEKKEKDEEEEDTLTREEDEPGQVAAAPAMMMRSFSLRSSAPAIVASTQGNDATAPKAVVSDALDILSWPSGSSVKFEDTANRAKEVQIDAGGVVADTVDITGSGYSFTGGNLVVTDRLSVKSSAGFDITLDVGANRIQGSSLDKQDGSHENLIASLENVKMLVTGEIHRPVTHDNVTVHNLITSADGNNAAVLRNVALHAGTSTEYATLHNIAFAGESSLTGYVTFEKTQTTGDIYVAAGGTLTLENLTIDLRGLSMGEKTLIVVETGGNLVNWNADNVHFVYSGVKVNSAAVDFSKGNGVIGFSWEHDHELYWSGAADNMWNIDSRNWSSSEDLKNNEVFTALSNVYFGGAGNHDISIMQDMVVADLNVTAGGYSFSGARVGVLGNAYLNPETGNKVTFHDQLVVQGNLVAGLDAEGKPVENRDGNIELLGTTTVAKNAIFNNFSTFIDADMTVGGTFKVNAGDDDSAGSLTIYGNVTATAMDIAVSGGGNNGTGLVDVTGNLTVDKETGIITIGGTAEQKYLGVVTAGNLIVNTQVKDVYFDHLHVGKLTVGKDAHVHVQTSSAASSLSTSTFPEIYLSGTLALDAHGATYNQGYDVYVQDDAASLVFGTDCTIDNLNIIGQQDASGYTNVDIEVNSRSATVTEMRDLGTLKVETGTLTVNNAGGAIHGELILNNGKLQLGENTNDIMAAGSGAVRLENGGILDIGKSSQTLSANNQVFLSGASTITSEADGGLSLGDGLTVNYTGTGNSIDARLTVDQGHTITLKSEPASDKDVCSLEIDGLISGSGEMKLTGKGTVVLYGANPDFTGKVTVDGGSTLTLLNTDSLSNAGVILGAGGTLALNAPGAVTLNALTFSNGSTLDISSIVATEDFSDLYAVLNVDKNAVTFGSPEEKVELNLIFSEELDTMKTYNLMTGVSSIDNLSFNIQHNGAALDDSQYKIGYDSTTGLLYITTMMGNVWNGEGTGESAKIWSSTGGFANWSGEKYNENETLGYTAAVFRDLTQKEEEVTVQGPVNPGDIYFTADATKYTLASDETNGGSLAAGTHIHKIGEADVTLSLAGNTTKDTALGNVEVQAGSLILGNDLAVKGTVTVEKDANLKLKGESGGLTMFAKKDDEAFITYSVSAIGGDASLSGVTMDAVGIRGTGKNASSADKLLVQGTAHLSNLTLSNFETNRYDDDTKGIVTLSDVTLDSTGKLRDVVIGAGVDVAASASYTLSGAITFDSTLTNKGTITLDNVTSIEIGKLQHTLSFDAETGFAQYDYQLIKLDEKGVVTEHSHASSQFTINGVKLEGGLNVGVDIKYDGKGALSLIVDDGNVGIPQWDERWGKTDNSPVIACRYTGTGDSDNVKLAAGDYEYSSIVKDASNVNGGNAIVTLLSSVAKANTVASDIDNAWGTQTTVANHEVWIYDSSHVKTVIGGLAMEWMRTADFSELTTSQTGATHVLVNTAFQEKDSLPNDYKQWDKWFVIGGSRWCNQNAESFVSVQRGEIYTIYGASCGGYYGPFGWELPKDKYGEEKPGGADGAWLEDYIVVKDDGGNVVKSFDKPYLTQTGTAHVFVDGGRIGEIFAGGYFASITGTQKVEVAGTERVRAVEMVLTGGTLGMASGNLRVFGGTDHGIVEGDIYIRMEGAANVESRLVGGSNAGAVCGDIVLDLISGSAFRVDAAGLGWYSEWYDYENEELVVYYDPAYIAGNVRVNLYSDFMLGTGSEYDFKSGIYGGLETTNHILLADNCYSELHFAESAVYELGYIDSYGLATTASHYVTGFDRFELEDDAQVVLSLGYFDIEMDPEKTLAIGGKGVVEVIGRGANFGRNIELEDSATLKISTCDIGTTESENVRTIFEKNGTTVDFTGFSITGLSPNTPGMAGLDFDVKICGNGVDGKGALYMGQSTQTSKDTNANVNEIFLPDVELTASASVKVVAQEALYMDSIKLAGHTLTKLGAGDFIIRSVDKVDEMTVGTILVQQGTFGFTQDAAAAETDMVLAAGAKLKLNVTEDWEKDDTDAPETSVTTANLTLRSLSGAGTVEMNGSTLTLHTNEGHAYYTEYMPKVYTGDDSPYDQFSGTTGFGYAVFGGLITDGDKITDIDKTGGTLVKSGSGKFSLSGSGSTYTGGTQLQEGRLYLLGTSAASTFTKGTSKAAAGVAGTGTIVWNRVGETNPEPALYLGHGTRIYNNGITKVDGGVMTIGVEGASGVLANFVGVHGTVMMRGVEYVEIDTHNLKAIAVDGLYADGTAYVAGTDIDRNKMLLVEESVWDTAKNTSVTSLSDTGYNEAVYSGVLSGEGAKLHKVGVGTLVLDQQNTYTGGTEIDAGTLRVRGWGTLGKNEKENTAIVHEGATLMFTHNSGYGNEPTEAANDIRIEGRGDALWANHAATDKGTAALISAVGPAVTFALSGDISGSGNVRHSGEGKLVLSGDSSYEGGTYVSRGTVEVQSAKGLGATASGKGSVTVEHDADLRVTVERDYKDARMVTTLAADTNDIKGDVYVQGTADTERILHMDGNGYNAVSTTLDANGTLLINGAAINGTAVKAESELLTGSGNVVVSDATASGASAVFTAMENYIGDFRVEGDKASIHVKSGAHEEGSIHVAGQQASVHIGGHVYIAAGESLHLRSTGAAGTDAGTSALLASGGVVGVASGAVFSVSNAETEFAYNISELNLSELKDASSVTLGDLISPACDVSVEYHQVGADVGTYTGRFDATIAVNKQAVGAVQAAGGLTLAGGATYETLNAHTSLLGGSLTLDVLENNQITLHTSFDIALEKYTDEVQLVLFSDVGSVNFALDGVIAKAGEGEGEGGVYYTRADRYLTGSDYVNSQTMLVYDSEAGVVYLQTTRPVPEPATTALSLLAVSGLLARRRRRD